MINKTILAFVILLNFIVLSSCSNTNDEGRLKQRISELSDIIEERNTKDVRNYLSSDFLTSEKLNNEKFLLYVHYQFKRNKKISVTILNQEIRLYDSKADVIANVLLLGAGEWLPERGQAYNVESRWIKEGGNWVMSRLRWSKK